MKNEILIRLKEKGFNPKEFDVHTTSKLQETFKVHCSYSMQEKKYILLYVEPYKKIIIWEGKNTYTYASIPRAKITTAINQKKNYVLKGKEFSNRQPIKVYISSLDDIDMTINKISKES